jgi:hypothetical protein
MQRENAMTQPTFEQIDSAWRAQEARRQIDAMPANPGKLGRYQADPRNALRPKGIDAFGRSYFLDGGPFNLSEAQYAALEAKAAQQQQAVA